MGCGKSSVGRRLSELLCCPFMDLDSVIEEREGRTIPEIFATDGEEAFRRMEKESLEHVLNTQETRQCATLAPSHFVGPVRSCYRRLFAAKVHWTVCRDALDPYAGVRKCQFRTNALSPEPPLIPTQENNDHESSLLGNEVKAVLALGGGTVMTRECAEMVHEKTLCIYLRASVETLLAHLTGETDGRPMLSSEGDDESSVRSRIEDLMALRAETYEKTAHVIIDTDGKGIVEIAESVLKDLVSFT